MDTSLTWKSSKSQNKETIKYSDITSLDWIFTTKGYQLRIYIDNITHFFSGFKKEVRFKDILTKRINKN